MRFSLIAAALLLPAVGAAQTTVYTNTFESGVAGAAFSGGGTVQGTGGLDVFGFGAQHLKNDGTAASILTLGGLASHSSMSLTFDLAMWDSIDYNDDTFQITADGVNLFSGTFGNYGAQSGQCEGPGTVLTPPFLDFNNPNYGYSANHDCARHVTFSFAHTSSSAVFSWQYPNSQNAPDESFGIDNILVQTNATAPVTTAPEPGTYLLVAAGLGAMFTVRRKVAR
ncbi:MAG: PEP-CTERM sorting domain-containing protein [Gemmatimonas sp.]